MVDGRVFLGGGFGSYDFFALDAADGTLAWQYQTADDGPTAAVVDDGHVAFNTESCELEVLTVDGQPVWKKWLGDPLMSMPAVGEGRVYMAYPDSRGDRRHYLACFDLATGREHWRQPIDGEVITCPVLAEGHVHFATLDGTLYRFRQDDGHVDWKEPRNATSSPVVWEGECYFSQRQEVPEGGPAQGGVHQTEHLAAQDLKQADLPQVRGDVAQGRLPRPRQAEARVAALRGEHAQGRRRRLRPRQGRRQDGPGDEQPRPRPRPCRLGLPGLQAVRLPGAALRGPRRHRQLAPTPLATRSSGRRRSASRPRRAEELLDSPLTPPAIANGKLFFGTIQGEVHCLSAATGEVLWSVPVGEPVIFQPAVAGGRVYVATDAGSLFCLETGDPADDGWLMWGADASHNGRLD